VAPPAALGEQGIAQGFEGLGTLDEVDRQRRRADVGFAILLPQLDAGPGADILEQLLEPVFVTRGAREVSVVLGFQVQGNVGASLGQQRDDALPLAERAKLLGAADLRGVGAGREQGQNDMRLIESCLDFVCPRGAPADAVRVEL
jgi:hypothetical protein